MRPHSGAVCCVRQKWRGGKARGLQHAVAVASKPHSPRIAQPDASGKRALLTSDARRVQNEPGPRLLNATTPKYAQHHKGYILTRRGRVRFWIHGERRGYKALGFGQVEVGIRATRHSVSDKQGFRSVRARHTRSSEAKKQRVGRAQYSLGIESAYNLPGPLSR
ncbi:hypothetical protein PENSPDRAFT_670704 [Peniophora sp. CONT]|nr:hypothetical protein PENSPDRAFT_670704 [Peniophora sp. CONT]